MASEQSIRITAKGEFGQLRSGLKNLQSDLRNVTGEIDRGARKGGIFDENQLRALDLFRRRFKDTMGELDREFSRQNDVVDRLHEQMKNATFSEREEIRKNIKEREKELDVIRKQLMEMERMYERRAKEASGYSTAPPPQQAQQGNNAMGGFLQGAAGKILNAGKFMLGMAGVGSILGLVHEAYQQAYAREVGSLDLAQRIRGSSGRFGSATDMYDVSGQAGMRDGMGYTKQESWQFLDQYSRLAGAISAEEQYELLKFGRGYGLSSSEVASLVGTHRGVGGLAPSDFADSIAGSVSQSGMTSRIVEVMETNNTLLQQMNTTLKDGSSKQILAYQTTLDRIGMAQGMYQLTGSQGANIIGGLGGIFSPQDDNWKWMGIRALQAYDPAKYGNMDLFGLEMSFEDGLLNPDNIPAMSQYVKGMTGGNTQLSQRILQRWLTDGGFVATKREAQDLWEATNGLEVFSEDQMAALRNGSIDSGAAYDQNRQGERGQGFLDTDARFQAALEGIGGELVGAVMGLKESATQALEWLDGELSDSNSTLSEILRFLKDNWKLLATAAGITALGNSLLGVAGLAGVIKSISGIGGILRLGIPVALMTGGTAALVKAYEEADQFIKDGGFSSESLAKARFLAEHGLEPTKENMDRVPDWITHPAQLDMERSSTLSGNYDGKYSYYKEDQRYYDSEWGRDEWDIVTTPRAEQNAKYLEMLQASSRAGTSISDREVEGLAEWLQGMGESHRARLKADMEDTGDSAIGRMPRDVRDFSIQGRRTLEDFTEVGQQKLTDLTNETGNRLRSLEDIHATQMDKVASEHSGFKTMMYFLFNPLAEAFRRAEPGAVQGRASGRVGGGAFQGASSSSFFNGWENRVTSRFQSHESFRKSAHGGLDIDGEQGDFIDALASGVISKITYDDGSERDNDRFGRGANTNPGGTEVVIRMPDGKSYFYSHLSKVNPDLKVGDRVDAGDWVGNMGGDPGMPGSGSSTTGSHLHLGYVDERGVRRDPEELLKGLGVGNHEEFVAPKDAGDSAIGNTSMTSEVNVNLNISGEGASQLNHMTIKQLESVVTKIMAEVERKRMGMNPTRAGYSG